MLPQRLTNWNRADGLRSEMDRLFDEFLPDLVSLRRIVPRPAFPAVNLWEDAERVHVEAELPGLQLANLEVQVTGDELTISGERSTLAPEGAAFHRRERGAGSFSRVVHLPCAVDAEGVQAALQQGVLTVTLPKAAEARPRRIEVKVA